MKPVAYFVRGRRAEVQIMGAKSFSTTLKNSQTKRKSQGVISIFPPIILPIHGMTHDKNDETNS